MAPSSIYLLSLLTILPMASANFHLFTRYTNYCDTECNKKSGVCYPLHVPEWRVGAVPSNNYNCNSFKNDKYFPSVLGQYGQDFAWNGYQNFPDICGSGRVDFWVTNNGQTLEVWKHAANPGVKVASCYRQSGDEINCGDKSCAVTKVHDAWVCADTNLC
ncbi:hypothetical protein B0J11DRAFT_513784 [Dendryphion nanum]|uniref:Secreted protein n=1 Tax=Dendryphion nanum TaxID=256645 RepID=A0A9P9EJE7_9PLEO|nr:hypothetical protein B0J11DRAFT_513784 [Dendryphion nanum]